MNALLLYLVTQACIAQTGCVPELDEIDQFTKEHHIVYRTIPMANTWFGARDSRLRMEYRLWTRFATSIIDGAPVILLFLDGTTMELKNINTDIADPSGYGSWSLETRMIISREQLSILSTKTIKAMRFYCAGGYVDKEVKAKHAKDMQQTAWCLLATIR